MTPPSAGQSLRLSDQMRGVRLRTCPETGHFGEGITNEDMAKLKWVRPELVVQVSFTEWTSSGLLRHATFLGLRNDKSAREIGKEQCSDDITS